MRFAFGFFFFLFYLLRLVVRVVVRGTRRRETYSLARQAFEDLAAQYGGNSNAVGLRRLIYVTADRSVELQIRPDTRKLTLRLRKPFAVPVTFHKLPRLLYAFLEAFLDDSMKLEGTHYLVGSRDSQLLRNLKTRNGFLPLMQRLNQEGFSAQLGPYGLKLSRTMRPEEMNDANLMNIIRLAQDLSRLGEPEVLSIPIQQVSSEKLCAYCKESLQPTEPAHYCEWCGTPHHQDCFELNGKCTVYGCARSAQQQEVLTN